MFVPLHMYCWYHNASRRCQKLSDVSDEATSDVLDEIPCQMASDTSTLLSTTSLLWRALNDISSQTNLAWFVLQTFGNRITDGWTEDPQNHHQPPSLAGMGLSRQECPEKRNCGKACGAWERAVCWPLLIVEWLRRCSQIPRTLPAPLYLWKQTSTFVKTNKQTNKKNYIFLIVEWLRCCSKMPHTLIL